MRVAVQEIGIEFRLSFRLAMMRNHRNQCGFLGGRKQDLR